MRRLLLGAAALVTAGCMLPGEKTDTTPAFRVKCGGECVELATAQHAHYAGLVSRVDELLQAQRHASITSLVERNLEDAIECLRQREGKPDTLDAVARAVDKLIDHPPGDGWAEYLQKRGAVAIAEDAGGAARAAAKNKQWKNVISILDRQEISRSPYHAIHAHLLRSEAMRHLGKNSDATESWHKAAVQAATLKANRRVPMLWERIAGQRPVGTAWPKETCALMRTLPDSLHAIASSAEFTPELLVWHCIGTARFERGEPSDALTAFKRADTAGRFREWDDFLLLHQAKALLAMRQTPAATGLLTALIERPERSRWRGTALSLLGSGKLNDGHAEQALAFLREASPATDANNPWHTDALANLGLAHLMAGNEAKGIESLREAQHRFTQAHDIGGLLLCLDNEAGYWQQSGRANLVQQVRARIQELEVTLR